MTKTNEKEKEIITAQSFDEHKFVLKHRDCRQRVMKREGGDKTWIQINRIYCSKCHRLHTELPDCLVPFKHYAS